MTDHPFNNDASPAERKAVTENDARVREQQRAATYASFAEAFADEDRRYNTGKPPIHTAATPVYPELPSNSPFHHDPVGQEPPLGFSVEDHQPVGTFQEVQESLKRLGEAGPSSPGSPDSGAAVAPASSSPPCADAVETAAPTTFTDDNWEPPRAA